MYRFRAITDSDFDLLFSWINSKHVAEWWGTPPSREEFDQKYSTNIESELVHPHVVDFEGSPIGYINYWYVEEDPDFVDMYSSDTVGTDQYIGRADYLNKGHGSKMVEQFTNFLLSKPNINTVITDPDVENNKAIQCYKKAGFVPVKNMQSAEGNILLMEKKKSGI